MPRRIAPSISVHGWPFGQADEAGDGGAEHEGDLVGAERGLVAEQVHRGAEQGDEQDDGDERLAERGLDPLAGGLVGYGRSDTARIGIG